jgi:hypothetical protein
MKDLKFGNLELKTRYAKGALARTDIAFGYSRSAVTYERIFHYDCDTGVPTPTSLNPSKTFGATLWCEPVTPVSLGGSFLLTEEERREMDRKSTECEQALIKASGLTTTQFSQVMAPNFPPVTARIPVDKIRRLIPNFTFSVDLQVYWIHIYCEPNLAKFPCSTFIRFPFAYDFDFVFEKSCDGSKLPEVDTSKRYFELSQFEKEGEREGLEFHRAMDKAFGEPSPPLGLQPKPDTPPEGH